MPRQINFFVILIIIFLIYNTTLNKNNVFDFILIIYGCSFFQYGNNVGGIFNLIAFFVAILFFFKNFHYKNNFNLFFKNQNKTIQVLLFIIIIFNILGLLIKSKSSIFNISIGVISFFSFIQIFLLTSNIDFNKTKLEKFIKLSNVLFHEFDVHFVGEIIWYT